MDFYTNVIVFGNSVLVRGIKNGERVTSRLKYKPTLFVPVRKQTQYRSLDGKFLTPMVQENIKDAKEFVDQYSNQPGSLTTSKVRSIGISVKFKSQPSILKLNQRMDFLK